MTTLYDVISFGLDDLRSKFKKKDEHLYIYVFGLQNGGKSTLLAKICEKNLKKKEKEEKLKNMGEITPTKGINVYTTRKKNYRIVFLEMGGQKNLREYWEEYFNRDIDGVLWVIDGSDDIRKMENVELFEQIFNTGDRITRRKMYFFFFFSIFYRPICIFFNKNDLVKEKKINNKEMMYTIINSTGVSEYKSMKIINGSAKSEENVDQLFNWLVKKSKKKNKEKKKSLTTLGNSISTQFAKTKNFVFKNSK